MIGFLITGTIALLLISALVAPLESLGWWAGWLGEHDPLPIEQAPEVTALVPLPTSRYRPRSLTGSTRLMSAFPVLFWWPMSFPIPSPTWA